MPSLMLLALLTVTVPTCSRLPYFCILNFHRYAAAAVRQIPPLQKPFVPFNASTLNNDLGESAKYKMSVNPTGLVARSKGEYKGLRSD